MTCTGFYNGKKELKPQAQGEVHERINLFLAYAFSVTFLCQPILPTGAFFNNTNRGMKWSCAVSTNPPRPTGAADGLVFFPTSACFVWGFAQQ